MTSAARACLALTHLGSIEFEDDKFAGPHGAMMNEVIEQVTKKSNFTIDIRAKNDGVGELDPATGEYDGCIGRLQRNESDVLFQLSDYPLNATGVTQGDAGFDATFQYLTFYYPRKSNEVSSTPVESCFKSFDETVWSVCLATLFILYLLIITRSRTVRKLRLNICRTKWEFSRQLLARMSRSHSSSTLADDLRIRLANSKPTELKESEGRRKINEYYMSKLLTHATRFGSLDEPRGTFKKIIFLVCSFYSLLVVHYFGSLINTELVTVEPPDIYRSYQDLIDNKVAVAFLKGIKTELFFESGPKEKKLWDFSLEKYGRSVIETTMADIQTTIFAARQILFRKMVFITDSIYMPMSLRECCHGLIDEGRKSRFAPIFSIDKTEEAYNAIPIWSQDESAKPVMKSLLFSDAFRGHPYEHTRKVLRTFFELGLTLEFIERMQNQEMLPQLGFDVGETKSQTYDEIRLCRERILRIPDIDVNAVTFGNFQHFFLFVLLLLFIALLLLGMEAFYHKNFMFQSRSARFQLK